MDETIVFDDGLVPNDGEAFYRSESEEQRERELTREVAIIEQAKPLLESIYATLDKSLAAISDIDTIDLTSPVGPAAQILGHQIARQHIEQLKTDLEAMQRNAEL